MFCYIFYFIKMILYFCKKIFVVIDKNIKFEAYLQRITVRTLATAP